MFTLNVNVYIECWLSICYNQFSCGIKLTSSLFRQSKPSDNGNCSSHAVTPLICYNSIPVQKFLLTKPNVNSTVFWQKTYFLKLGHIYNHLLIYFQLQTNHVKLLSDQTCHLSRSTSNSNLFALQNMPIKRTLHHTNISYYTELQVSHNWRKVI